MTLSPQEDRIARDAAESVYRDILDEAARGGSVMTPEGMVPPGMWRCCDQPKRVVVGGCNDGCCTDYRCEHCGKTWRYEWPD